MKKMRSITMTMYYRIMNARTMNNAGYVHKGNRTFERFDRDEEKTEHQHYSSEEIFYLEM